MSGVERRMMEGSEAIAEAAGVQLSKANVCASNMTSYAPPMVGMSEKSIHISMR